MVFAFEIVTYVHEVRKKYRKSFFILFFPVVIFNFLEIMSFLFEAKCLEARGFFCPGLPTTGPTLCVVGSVSLLIKTLFGTISDHSRQIIVKLSSSMFEYLSS